MSKSKTKGETAQPAAPGQRADNAIVLYTAAIVRSYVEHNRISPTDIPALIGALHVELQRLAAGTPAVDAKGPAVPIKKSVGDDFIVCLEDGKRLTMLKRYLKTHHNMTPDEYRKKWGLPIDYPMVAPAYARLRSAFAKKVGLGRVPATKAARK